MIDAILKDPQLRHMYFDISWDEVAKYLTATPESIKISADLINRYPDRFLFGTDEVAPSKRARRYVEETTSASSMTPGSEFRTWEATHLK